MQLTEHFSLDELTQTQQRGLSNQLPLDLLSNLEQTAQMLERIRASLSDAAGKPVPILVSSGYRSEAVNRAVGGSPTSDHVKAMAVDFRAPAFGSPYAVAKHLATRVDELGIGQVIHEFGRWVHVSSKTPAKLANRVITIDDTGTQLGVQVVA